MTPYQPFSRKGISRERYSDASALRYPAACPQAWKQCMLLVFQEIMPHPKVLSCTLSTPDAFIGQSHPPNNELSRMLFRGMSSAFPYRSY